MVRRDSKVQYLTGSLFFFFFCFFFCLFVYYYLVWSSAKTSWPVPCFLFIKDRSVSSGFEGFIFNSKSQRISEVLFPGTFSGPWMSVWSTFSWLHNSQWITLFTSRNYFRTTSLSPPPLSLSLSSLTLFISPSCSLSLSLYIYIYIYIYSNVYFSKQTFPLRYRHFQKVHLSDNHFLIQIFLNI